MGAKSTGAICLLGVYAAVVVAIVWLFGSSLGAYTESRQALDAANVKAQQLLAHYGADTTAQERLKNIERILREDDPLIEGYLGRVESTLSGLQDVTCKTEAGALLLDIRLPESGARTLLVSLKIPAQPTPGTRYQLLGWQTVVAR